LPSIFQNLVLNRKFIFNLFFLISLNLLIKPFWIFGIDRIVQNSVGTATYGWYFSLFNFSFLFNMLLDVGLTSFNSRNIAQNRHLLSKSLQQIFVIKLFLACAYFLLTFLVAFVFRYDSQQVYLLIFLTFNQFLLSFILYFRSNISGLQLFKLDSLLSVLDRLLLIIFCSLMIWGPIFGPTIHILNFVYLQTASYLLTWFVCLTIVWAKSGRPAIGFIKWGRAVAIIRQSLPYALLILLMSVYFRADSVMLERLLPDGKTQAGIYAQAFRIIDGFSAFAYLFPSLLLPMFAYMLKNKQDISGLARLSFVLLFVPSVILAVSASFFSSEIMTLLYREHTSISDDVLKVLITSFIGYSFTYVFGTLLTANGNLKQLNRLAFFALMLNLCLNYLFIKAYGAKGAAFANLVTQGVMAVGQWYLARKVFNLRFAARGYFKMFIFMGSLVLFALFVKFGPVQIPWVYAFAEIVVAGFLLAFLFRLFSLREILKLLNLNSGLRKNHRN
jgi:O-antigen/teichoic acid export membrane protein